MGRVSAVDEDLGDNSELSYSIVSHWGRDKFSLHPHTGVFTLIGTLDYEEVTFSDLRQPIQTEFPRIAWLYDCK